MANAPPTAASPVDTHRMERPTAPKPKTPAPEFARAATTPPKTNAPCSERRKVCDISGHLATTPANANDVHQMIATRIPDPPVDIRTGVPDATMPSPITTKARPNRGTASGRSSATPAPASAPPRRNASGLKMRLAIDKTKLENAMTTKPTAPVKPPTPNANVALKGFIELRTGEPQPNVAALSRRACAEGRRSAPARC